ncbi:energy transducer TonB, partial [Rhodovarius lipocyclicus]|uniref:energy transducer TonB n=1 Tax=Rhodovarius lipocyclicus TaxID=268410 RepID=UPI001358C1F4
PPSPAERPGTPAPPGQESPAGPLGGATVTGPTRGPGLDPAFRNAAPGYPQGSRERGEQGVVSLLLNIGTDGRIITLEVTRSSGYPALDEAARRAVREWRFRPALRGGTPVPSQVATNVRFTLN